jgi:hypothetical protein
MICAFRVDAEEVAMGSRETGAMGFLTPSAGDVLAGDVLIEE